MLLIRSYRMIAKPLKNDQYKVTFISILSNANSFKDI